VANELAFLGAILRRDFAIFIAKVFETLCPGEIYHDNWHLDCLAHHLALAASGQRIRLIINLPPRSLKSIAASVALPAWLLGHNASCRIITVSYSEELARKHARDCRVVIESDWYRSTFPATRLSRRKNTETEITTTHHGFRLATSIGGTLTGRGGNVLIIDDPIKPADAESETERRRVNDWYDKTLFSRLDDKEAGAIIVVMQRLHEDDFTGYLTEKGEFDVLALPAIAIEQQSLPTGHGRFHLRSPGEPLYPGRENLATLERTKTSVGSRVFEAQYQQSPAPLGDGIVKAEWFKRYGEKDRPERFDRIVQSWDTANKATELSDFSVCTTWGVKGKNLYLLGLFRRRLEYPALKRAVRELQSLFAANEVLIEDKASGTQLIQELITDGCYGVTPYQPTCEKIMRVHAQTAMIENFVYIPEAAPWLAEYLHELMVFPNGKHDDQVDSTAQFLDWFKKPYPGQALLEFYGMRRAERRQNPENPERYRVRLQAPPGLGSVQTFSGRHINVSPDGTIEMSADDAQYLIRAGWAKLAEWTRDEAA
jgi:predicted phage terminase large subunit-like protein